MDKLGESILGVAEATGYSTGEVGKMALQLMRAGIQTDDLSKTLDAVAKVARVSGEDLNTVGDTIAIIKSAWGMSGAAMAETANILTNALNYSRLTIEDFGTALNYLAGTSAVMGKSFREVAAIMSVLSNMGVRASTMGTGLSQVFSELVAPGKKFRDELARIKVAEEEVNITTHCYIEILKKLTDAGFDINRAMDVMADRTARSLMFAFKAGGDEIYRMYNRLGEANKLLQSFDIAMSGPIKAMEQLRAR